MIISLPSENLLFSKEPLLNLYQSLKIPRFHATVQTSSREVKKPSCLSNLRLGCRFSKCQGKSVNNRHTAGTSHQPFHSGKTQRHAWGWKNQWGITPSPGDCQQTPAHSVSPLGHQSIRRPRWQVGQRSILITNGPSFPFVWFVLNSWHLSPNCRYYI